MKFQTMVKDVKEENIELKARLNSIENKLLESNFILTGVSDDPLEQESNLQDKVYDLIAYTVNAQDVQVQLQSMQQKFTLNTMVNVEWMVVI